MKKILKTSIFWVVPLILIFVAIRWQVGSGKQEKSSLGVVSYGDLVQRVTVSGSVISNRKTVISAPYNGYVKKLYVKLGELVRPGDPIVSIAQSLRTSSDEIYPLRAPFPGTVVQILRLEGEFVDQSASGSSGIVRIDDLSKMSVEASVPESEVRKLKLGQEAMIKASAILSHPYKGKIKSISLASKEQKDWEKSRVEFPVQIEVVDFDQDLMPGMSVIVDVITSKLTHVLLLRHEFVQKDGDQFFVTTNQGQKKKVEIGLQNEEHLEIKAGVQEGEQVQIIDFLSLQQGS